MSQPKIIQCSGCGKYQATTSTTAHRCNYCGRHLSMKGRRDWYKGMDDLTITQAVQHLNYMREVERHG